MSDAWLQDLSAAELERCWRQRNSDGLGTGCPPPARYIDEEEVVLPTSELGAGQTVTFQRHRHAWSVPEPD